MNGSARLLCVASDPGPTERVAGRTLVGDAGQRVQGFVSKLGLTRSYVMVNAFALAYALLPSHANQSTPLLGTEPHLTWRNTLLDLITGPTLQAVVAFGVHAQAAVDLWTDRAAIPRLDVLHPSSRGAAVLAERWRAAITELRGVVTPDPDGDATGPNYGPSVAERDYAAIPRRDLPYGLPSWFGDDARGRRDRPRHNSYVERSGSDLPAHVDLAGAHPGRLVRPGGGDRVRVVGKQ